MNRRWKNWISKGCGVLVAAILGLSPQTGWAATHDRDLGVEFSLAILPGARSKPG